DVRQVRHEHGHGKDEVRRVAGLDELVVDATLETDRVGVLDLINGDEHRAERREPGKGLTEAELRGRPSRELDVTRREVLGRSDSGDVAPRLGGRDASR